MVQFQHIYKQILQIKKLRLLSMSYFFFILVALTFAMIALVRILPAS